MTSEPGPLEGAPPAAAAEPASPAAEPAWPESPVAPVAPIAPVVAPDPAVVELEARIRRDLARGRSVVAFTWIDAILSAVLGLVSMRQSALLVAIDRHLVTTEEIDGLGHQFDPLRAVLFVAVALTLFLAIRWYRGALPTFRRLVELGVVAGPRGGSRLDRWLLPWRAAGVSTDRAGWADLHVPDGRRLVNLTIFALVLAADLGIIAMIGLATATTADDSRLWRFVLGLSGACWLIAFILVGASIDAARWREAAAARAIGVFIPLVDAPGRTLVRLVPPVFLLAAGIFVVNGRPDPWFVPCPQATLDCDGMLVPADHDGGSNATIWVVYAIHRAVGPPLGTLAIAVGGPGVSGLDESLDRIETFPKELVDRYDLLFWDQRGIGASEGRDCPHAGSRYANAVAGPAAADAFVPACLSEAGVDPADVARYSTHQAAEDLDSIRDRLGLPKIALYGESYGTELAQTYAAAHPDRLSALILDGAVDLTRSANDFWADATRGFDHVLDDTFAACQADVSCRSDVADPGAEYDAAIRSFDANPRDISYADPDGKVRDHAVDANAIEESVMQLIYEPEGRSLVLRAVAAYARGDEVPLARLTDLLGSGEGVGVSEFAYHAITCADYRVSPTSDPHDFAALQAYADEHGLMDLRTSGIFTAQDACLAWPYQPATGARPAPITTTPYPVVVLGATDDPITPIDQARAISTRLTDGYLVTTTGGPHVTFGRDDACVDDPVVRLLVEGTRPPARTVSCGGEAVSGYVGLTPEMASEYTSALDAMQSTETELFADPDVALWNGVDQLTVGCRDGGFFVLTDLTKNDNLRFADCQIVAGLPLTGLGTYDPKTGDIGWDVTFPDGSLTYSGVGSRATVSGRWKGQPVQQSS